MLRRRFQGLGSCPESGPVTALFDAFDRHLTDSLKASIVEKVRCRRETNALLRLCVLVSRQIGITTVCVSIPYPIRPFQPSAVCRSRCPLFPSLVAPRFGRQLMIDHMSGRMQRLFRYPNSPLDQLPCRLRSATVPSSRDLRMEKRP